MKINFSEIANLVTKGDNKISEEDAQKAKQLGLSFVLAGMTEEDFNKAVTENQKEVEAYLANDGWLDKVGRKIDDLYNQGVNWVKDRFSDKNETLFNDNGKLNIKTFSKELAKIINAFPEDLEKQDEAIKELLGDALKEKAPIRGAENGYMLKDGTMILDNRGHIFGDPYSGTISIIDSDGKETEVYKK